MHWLLIPLTVLAGWFLGDLAATIALRFLSWFPYAWIRRWVVFLSMFFVGVPLLVLLVTSLFLALDEWLGLAGSIIRFYQDVPTLTIWIGAFCVPFVAGLLLIGFRGLWPQSEVPYLPRAANWRITTRFKRSSLLFALLAVAVIIQDFELKWRLSRLASQATATGESMRPAAIHESTNAAVHYQEIAALQRQFTAEEGDYWAQPDYHAKEALEYLERIGPLLAEFHLAAEREGCCFEDAYQPLHIIDGMDTNFGLVSAVKRLCWSAHLAIEQGRYTEAVKCIEVIRRLEEHLQIDRRNIKLVFFFWYEAYVRQIIEHLSAVDHALPEEMLREYQLPPMEWKEKFQYAWQWHGAEVKMRITDVYLGRGYEDHLPMAAGRGANLAWQAKLAIALGAATNRLLYARDDIRATQNYCRLSDYGFDERPWIDYEDNKLHPNGRYLGDLYDISLYPRYVQRGNVHRKLSNYAIAAMLYRREHNKWPATFEQLMPKQAKDGDSLRTMRYRDGLLVYSSDIQEHMDKHEDTSDWWQVLGEYRYGDLLLLGEAFTRSVEVQKRFKQQEAESEFQRY